MTTETHDICPKHMQKFHVRPGIPLTFEEAYGLGRLALRGCLWR
ncbi:MAG: hypothetical protein AB7G06_09410 [Bdellovibrionales bacterium]